MDQPSMSQPNPMPGAGAPSVVYVPVPGAPAPSRNVLGVFGFLIAFVGLFVPTGLVALFGLVLSLMAVGRARLGPLRSLGLAEAGCSGRCFGWR